MTTQAKRTQIVESLRAEAKAHRALHGEWHDAPSVDGSDCKEMLSMADLQDAAADTIDAQAARITELENELRVVLAAMEGYQDFVDVRASIRNTLAPKDR